MTETSDGGFVLAGDRLLKVDAAGSEQWEISFGGQTFPGGQASSCGSNAGWWICSGRANTPAS